MAQRKRKRIDKTSSIQEKESNQIPCNEICEDEEDEEQLSSPVKKKRNGQRKRKEKTTISTTTTFDDDDSIDKAVNQRQSHTNTQSCSYQSPKNNNHIRNERNDNSFIPTQASKRGSHSRMQHTLLVTPSPKKKRSGTDITETSDVSSVDSYETAPLIILDLNDNNDEENENEVEVEEDGQEENEEEITQFTSNKKNFSFSHIKRFLVFIPSLFIAYKQCQKMEYDGLKLFHSRFNEPNLENKHLQPTRTVTNDDLVTTRHQLQLSEEKERICSQNLVNFDLEYRTLLDKSEILRAEEDAKAQLSEAKNEIKSLFAQKNTLILSNSLCHHHTLNLSNKQQNDIERINDLETSLSIFEQNIESLKIRYEEEHELRGKVEDKLGKAKEKWQQLRDSIHKSCKSSIESLTNDKDIAFNRIKELEASVIIAKEGNDLLRENIETELKTARYTVEKLQEELNEEIIKGQRYKLEIEEMENAIQLVATTTQETGKSTASFENILSTMSAEKSTLIENIKALLILINDNKSLKSLYENELTLRKEMKQTLSEKDTSMSQVKQQLDKLFGNHWYALLQMKALENIIDKQSKSIDELNNMNNVLKEEKAELIKSMDAQMKASVSALNAVTKAAMTLR